MIKERYVSLEVAKLLKDKGFDEECFDYYVNGKPDEVKHSSVCETNSNWKTKYCSAPTQAVACDWIEEMFNIDIIVCVNIIGYVVYIGCLKNPNIYANVIQDDMRCGDNSDGSWSSKELAYNEAIKYVLTNLV